MRVLSCTLLPATPDESRSVPCKGTDLRGVFRANSTVDLHSEAEGAAV